jgi:hypothetical protein
VGWKGRNSIGWYGGGVMVVIKFYVLWWVPGQEAS